MPFWHTCASNTCCFDIWQQSLMFYCSENLDALCLPAYSDCRCMSHLNPLPSITMMNRHNQRQAYVRASFGWSRREMSWLISHTSVTMPATSSQSDADGSWTGIITTWTNYVDAAGHLHRLMWVTLLFSFLFFYITPLYDELSYIITTVNIRNLYWWPPPVTRHFIWHPCFKHICSVALSSIRR